MTPGEMTDEQLNIAICEWRGWKKVPRKPWWTRLEEWWTNSRITVQLSQLPSHITDIEALGNMHESEKQLSKDQRKKYLHRLGEITTGGFAMGELFYDEAWQAVTATARQRAMALLQVVKACHVRGGTVESAP